HRPWPDQPGTHRPWRHRDRHSGRGVRCVEPTDRGHGGCADSADPCSAPADRRRADPATRSHPYRDRVSLVRDMDTFMYERQSGADLEIGSYAHRPILHSADDIPSIEAAALSPTQLPFTEEDF